MADFERMGIGLTPYWPSPTKNVVRGESPLWTTSSTVDFIFQAEETATIGALGFWFKVAVSQSPRYKISFQGVTNGAPNGTGGGFGFFTPPLFNDPASWSDTWQWVSITPALMVRGTWYAIVIEYDSGTIGFTNYSTIYSHLVGAESSGWPFYADAPAGTRIVRDEHPIFGYRSTSGKVYGWPVKGHPTAVSTPSAEYGASEQQALGFTMPRDFGPEFKVAGVMWVGRIPENVNKTYSVKIYGTEADSGVANQELASITVDADMSSQDAGGSLVFLSDRVNMIFFNEDVLARLIFGRTYYLAIVPTDSAATVEFSSYEFAGRPELGALPGGAYFFRATRPSASSSWTILNERPWASLIISEWGSTPQPSPGLHTKFFSRYNDHYFHQHADDKIENSLAPLKAGQERHEQARTVIGKAIETYGGFLTVEVFKNPGEDFSSDTIIHDEQPIEELKLIVWTPIVDETAELVFRFRSKAGSDNFLDVRQSVSTITGSGGLESDA